MQPQIENAIMTAFADTMRLQSISLRQAERMIGVSDTYISRVLSQRIQPSSSFLTKAVQFITKQ